jgi:hypothetical protein
LSDRHYFAEGSFAAGASATPGENGIRRCV